MLPCDLIDQVLAEIHRILGDTATQARIDRVAAESHHGVGEGVAGDATFEPVGNPQARARFPPLLPQNFVRT